MPAFAGMTAVYGKAAVPIWDFLRLIEEKAREDKIFLLAGGVAFSVILAFIPLLVVTVTATTFFLDFTNEDSVTRIIEFLGNVIPLSDDGAQLLRDMLADIYSAAPTAVSVGTIAFLWLTTRLFGSLRAVLSDVFDVEETRNPIAAKLFDMRISLISSLFLMSYIAIRASLAIRVQGVGAVEYILLSVLAFLFIIVTFVLLYRYLPGKRVRWRTALVAGMFTSVMFEVARYVFALVIPVLNPASIYSGVIAVLIVPVVWSYYVALIFVLGGEVGQVYDLLRTRKIQRVVFE